MLEPDEAHHVVLMAEEVDQPRDPVGFAPTGFRTADFGNQYRLIRTDNSQLIEHCCEEILGLDPLTPGQAGAPVVAVDTEHVDVFVAGIPVRQRAATDDGRRPHPCHVLHLLDREDVVQPLPRLYIRGRRGAACRRPRITLAVELVGEPYVGRRSPVPYSRSPASDVVIEGTGEKGLHDGRRSVIGPAPRFPCDDRIGAAVAGDGHRGHGRFGEEIFEAHHHLGPSAHGVRDGLQLSRS